jgi:hypothetical protein
MEILLFILVALNTLIILGLIFKNIAQALFFQTRIKQISITVFILFVSLLSMSFINVPKKEDKNNKTKNIKTYTQKSFSTLQISNLKKQFAANKDLPKNFELQALIALSYYPEFKNIPIKFITRDIKTTMACQPDVKQILSNGKRAYIILIDSDKNGKGIELSEVPFNAQVGVIGHELAHIIDYETKNTLGLVGTGIGYLSSDYKHDLEHRIDAITIQKGLGYQLKDWADFAMNLSGASEDYKKFKKEIYMHPEEIDLAISGK